MWGSFWDIYKDIFLSSSPFGASVLAPSGHCTCATHNLIGYVRMVKFANIHLYALFNEQNSKSRIPICNKTWKIINRSEEGGDPHSTKGE